MSTRSGWLVLVAALPACVFGVEGVPGTSGTGGNGPPPDLAQVPSDAGVSVDPIADLSLAPMPKDAALPPPPDLAPSCVAPGILFCDDFESPRLLGWGLGQVNGSVTVDQQHVYHGQSALHVHQNAVAAAGSNAFLLRSLTYPSPDIYIRAFVYTASAPATATLVRVQQSQGQQSSVDLQVSPTGFQLRDSKTGALDQSNVAIPTGRWFCLQWQVHVAQSGFVSLSLDGTVQWTSPPEDATATPAWDWLVIGLQGDGPATPTDVWIDELAVSGAPIACDALSPG